MSGTPVFPGTSITEADVDEAYRTCETRLSSYRSHMLECARGFEDADRRNAIFATFHSLRIRSWSHLPRPLGRSRSTDQALRGLREWRDTARLCFQGQPDAADPVQIALADAFRRFQIPMGPWITLETGLVAVARGEPVPDVPSFMERGRTLALPPSSVFFRILSARRGHRRFRLSREADVDELAHDPAIFAYFVSVMCSIFIELNHSHPRCTSLPRRLLARHGLSEDDIHRLGELGTSSRAFQDLMEDMALFAWNFYESGIAKLTQSVSHLTPEAITHLDEFIGRYKDALTRLEKERFAPQVFEKLAASLEPRQEPAAPPSNG